ncbi:MAG: hypothetical protein GY856_45570 [bacterium]|nr:hypothetical protein [bacterium]
MSRILPFLWLFWILTPEALAAVDYGTPEEYSLDFPAVEFDLWYAEVKIVLDPEVEPVLRIRRPANVEAREDEFWLTAEQRKVILHRTEVTGGQQHRLKVEAVVHADQKLRLVGKELLIHVENPYGPKEASGEPAELHPGEEDHEVAVPSPGTGLDISIEDSEAQVTGVDGAVVEATATWLRFERTRGSLNLTLRGGRTEISGHRGRLRLDMTDGDAALSNIRGGPLHWQLRGGSLELRGGHGSCNGTAQEAVVLIDRWRGPTSITGSDTTIEARDLGGGNGALTLRGRDLQALIEQIHGPVAANLSGGQLTASALRGGVRVDADHDADVDLRDLTGKVVVDLKGGAGAELSDVAGQLQVAVHDGRLGADRIARLMLSGARAEIRASQIQRLTKLEVMDSEVDLDLTTVVHDPAIHLRGASSARLQLSSPCVVKVVGPKVLVGHDVWVSGCDLRAPGQPTRSAAPIRRYGRRPVTLTARISEQAALEVEGSS